MCDGLHDFPMIGSACTLVSGIQKSNWDEIVDGGIGLLAFGFSVWADQTKEGVS